MKTSEKGGYENNMILACHGISKSFGEKVIIADGSFHIEDHEKAALVGPNGAGKSTLFKMIVGELPSDRGEVILTKGKSLGYLAQHQAMQSGSTIYEEVKLAKSDIIEMETQIRSIELELKHLEGDALTSRLETYNRLTASFERQNGYAYESEINGVLKGLGFTENDFSKPVDTLSGGQKTRVSLGKLLLTKPDILLLDEPTNHLDIDSKEVLEEALENYTGTIFTISHDRYFLNTVVDKILVLSEDGITEYLGNYDYYINKKREIEEMATVVEVEEKTKTQIKDEKRKEKEQREKEKKNRYKIKNIEQEIEEIEGKIEELDYLLCQEEVYSNPTRSKEVSQEKSNYEDKLSSLYEAWEELV